MLLLSLESNWSVLDLKIKNTTSDIPNGYYNMENYLNRFPAQRVLFLWAGCRSYSIFQTIVAVFYF